MLKLRKKFNFLKKNAKVPSIWKKLQMFQVFGKKLPKSHNFGKCIVASDIILNIVLRIDFKIELRL